MAIDFGWPAVNKKAEAERLAREEAERLAEQARMDSVLQAKAAARAEAERVAREKAEAARIAAAEAAAKRAAAEEAARREAFKRSVEALTVHFDIAGAKLNMPEEEKSIVDELCEKMKADKSIKIVITGHTDNYGDPQQNLNYFGVKRAEALKAYMVNQGVPADQIRCESKGDKEPIAPNDTRANRAKNRRASIRFE
jgi:adhesin transport system outer membrane protein